MVRRLATLILPAELRDAGNQLAAALGHDMADTPNTYHIPLHSIGLGDTPTHYATSVLVTPEFEATIIAAQDGHYDDIPPQLVPLAETVIGGLIAAFEHHDVNATAHLNMTAAAHGLERRAEDINVGN